MAQTPLVSTDWLAAHLAAPGLSILDATKFLPPSTRDGRVAFEEAHIPGAGYFDIDVIADPDSRLPHTVPGAARFARLVGELGVGNDSLVVFYDQNATMWAARGWWMMRLFGHDRAAVLDGGLGKWQREGRPVESGAAPPTAPAEFRADWRARRVRGIGDMLANIDTGAELVLDARGAARFHAQVPEIRPGLRGGHIPGSHNVPYSDLLAPDGTLLPAEALRARLAAAGVEGDRPVTTTCGSGVSATLITLALAVAGLPEGAVYDGSWTEWGSRPDTPLET